MGQHEIYTFLKNKREMGDDAQDNILSKVRDVYTARYSHHIERLMDGTIKTRCICLGDESFSAKDSDYETLRSIWFRMIASWGVELSSIDNSIITKEIYNQVRG